jgi:4-aminobutyrate aminotransferase-like enzyme
MNARSLLLSTGAEANECALKYAKFLKKKDGIVSFSRAYHGLTHGTAAYSMSREKIRPTLSNSMEISTPKSFPDNPDVDGEEFALKELNGLFENRKDEIAAVILEPIISGGGFFFPSKDFFKKVEFLCKKFEALLILDECQTGMGRTGKWFYFQELDIVPDIVVTAKALGGGFPVAAVLMNENTIKNQIFEMKYFSSHQNEPFAGYITNFVIEQIAKQNLLERNVINGQKLRKILNEVDKDNEHISNVRGVGMMNAFDINPAQDLPSQTLGDIFVKCSLDSGLLLQHCNFGRTIRILPNYMIGDGEIHDFGLRLKLAISKFREEVRLFR